MTIHDDQHVCQYCLKHIAIVPLPVHEDVCRARRDGVDAHPQAVVQFAAHVQRQLAAGQTRKAGAG